MALADPQTITINAVPYVFNRVKSDGYRSEYATADEEYRLTVSHQDSKGNKRHMVRLDQRVVAADPLTSVNEYKECGNYQVIVEPEYGFTDTEIADNVAGFNTWLDAAMVAKILSGQH